MRTTLCAMLACALLSAGEADDPGCVVQIAGVSYQQRIDFALGSGVHPFADEDQRRVRLDFGVRTTEDVAVLGWRELNARASTEHDEDLPLSAMPDAGITTSHARTRDAYVALGALALPLTRQATKRLATVTGSVELRYSRVPAVGARMPLAELRVNDAHAVPGLTTGNMTVTELSSNRLVIRFDSDASLALDDIICRDAQDAAVPVRNRRMDWRDNQGQLTFSLKTAAITTIEVYTYRAIDSRRVAFSCRDLDLGLTVPSRDDLRGEVTRGAEDF